MMNSLFYAVAKVIISILQHAGALITADDMEPASYADKLFYDLKFSKATQTAKVSAYTNKYPRVSRNKHSSGSYRE